MPFKSLKLACRSNRLRQLFKMTHLRNNAPLTLRPILQMILTNKKYRAWFATLLALKSAVWNELFKVYRHCAKNREILRATKSHDRCTLHFAKAVYSISHLYNNVVFENLKCFVCRQIQLKPQLACCSWTQVKYVQYYKKMYRTIKLKSGK